MIRTIASLSCAALSMASAAEPPALQAALDAQPGTIISVMGVHTIDAPLRIAAAGSGLAGPGTIVQSNPAANIVEVAGAADVVLRGLTLTRAPGAMEAEAHAVFAQGCDALELDGLRVLDNRSARNTIHLEGCAHSVVRDCLVRNYKRVSVDDRTASPLYGYAFRVIDGTGIAAVGCTGVQILDNRVIETVLMPTQEVQTQFDLGRLVPGAHAVEKGRLAPPGDYARNWHQGSAIIVTGIERAAGAIVRGNWIENAAQGIDLHADQVLCTQNAIRTAFIGIKCMHGSQNVVISENAIARVDLWGIVMQPGTASHGAAAASEAAPARPGNWTSSNVIANNTFAEFGYGMEYWNWSESDTAAISLQSGPLEENPPLRDVLVTGNVVHDASMDGPAPPRYRWAVYLAPEPAPRNVVFRDNLFPPGASGVCNAEVSAS